MSPALLFILSILLSLSLSLGIIHYLRTNLLHVLASLCPAGQGTAFWLRFTHLMILVAPLILVVLFSPTERAGTTTALSHIKQVLVLSLGGQFLSLVVLGRGLWKAIQKAGTSQVPTVRPEGQS